MPSLPEAEFVSSPEGGERLYILHRTRMRPARGCVVHVHSFAEEVNKARAMEVDGARALQTEGYDVLRVDLEGCGDSSGDFEFASWDQWIADILNAIQWLQRERALEATWLWGVRTGCLLAAQAAIALARPINLLFWQPTPSGRQFLQQFLRLQRAAQWINKGSAATNFRPARVELQEGRSVEIAGYRLSPALASSLEVATLHPPSTASRLVWLEVGAPTHAPDLSLATQSAIATWRASGWHVVSQSVAGPSFWQSTEIERAPELVKMTALELST